MGEKFCFYTPIGALPTFERVGGFFVSFSGVCI